MADPGGCRRRAPLNRIQFFCFCTCFHRKAYVSEVGAPPPQVGAPPTEILDPPLILTTSYKTSSQGFARIGNVKIRKDWQREYGIVTIQVRAGSRISRRGGRGPILGGFWPPTWSLFSKNVCENERIGSCRGGLPWHAPLDPPMRR